MKLYVGNLPWDTTDNDLEQLFSSMGEVTSAKVITDRDSGRSQGFLFAQVASLSLGSAEIERFGIAAVELSA